MNSKLSSRLSEIVNALPLTDGMRVLEIGCGPGALASAIAARIKGGYVLGIDRSKTAIQQAVENSQKEISEGVLEYRTIAIEQLDPRTITGLFDLVVAIRVGGLDGRHPEVAKVALPIIASVLKEDGSFFIDGGKPLKEISLKQNDNFQK